MPPGLLDTGVLAFVTFLVAIDPLGMVPIFIALTRDQASAAQRRQTALKGTLIGAAILALFALFGEAALTGLGIGLPAFRIAGGITLLLLALEMIFERRGERRTATAEQLQGETPADDVAVFPLAIPLIAGPAAITAVILQTARHEHDPAGQVAVVLALAAVLAILYALLRASGLVGRRLSPTLVTVLSRLLGLLLAALAVQYVLDGLRQAFLAA